MPLARARNAVIVGAAGRDFHNFNVSFRNNPSYNVVAFTAAQIPFIEHREYPAALAGHLYPNGIPIYSEELLAHLIKKFSVDDVFFSYSDISYKSLMTLASIAMSAGAAFHFLGPNDTMLESKLPIIAVVASRSGAGKSSVSRKVVDVTKAFALKPAIVRHPMPYGDLNDAVQVFRTKADLEKHHATIEEREEYEQHLDRGDTVLAGVDYQQVLDAAEKESDIIVWDGGNNDFPFYRATITITVVDPLRSGHETEYYPGGVNIRMSDAIVVNKCNVASEEQIKKSVNICRELNSKAPIFRVKSIATIDSAELLRNKRVLVVEDGPTTTHGGLAEGVGASAARAAGAVLIDPKKYAVGTIAEAFRNYKHIGSVLPALGYSDKQIKDLEQSIQNVNCDAVVLGTPADLRRLIKIKKPVYRVHFEISDISKPGLEGFLRDRIQGIMKRATK